MTPEQHSLIPQDERLDRRAFVEPENVDVRAAALWSTLDERERGHRARVRVLTASGGALALAAAAALAFLFWPGGSETSQGWAGTTLESGSESTRVALADGSQVAAQPYTRLELLQATDTEVRLSLDHGEATFDVTPNQDRQFIVGAGDVEVRVLGTRFTVTRRETEAGEAIEVSVERGRVAVVTDRGRRELTRGHSWRRSEETHSPPHAEASPGPVAEAAEAEEAEGAAPPRPAVPSPAELFDAAAEARRSGSSGASARAYERFLVLYPRDGRAGLAAFELGRIRMDALGDASGAAQAFQRSIALAPRSPFREDATARLVRLYDQRNRTACERARDTYLSRFPSGRWASDVQGRCR